MEMRASVVALMAAAMLATSCAAPDAAFTNIYMADFHSDEPANCRTSDVPQSHGKAQEFFSRARQVDYKTLHDNYELAPCYVEGTLNRQGKSCDWQIRAGATGSVQCGEQKLYFACDSCNDLFGAK
ncbi:hypothetical protein [Variovorax sp. EL159]|uniref:hypothetical protein n=1 Tax=Variovorax sp. EL159 TaxID=1566270 RepID=UPI0008837F0C|nr:hypothetical protein [Variovorax sp. EL159]SCX48042.1 hypothetical protein SAMN03159363_1124 [Variovorax sp. EL159]